MTHEILKHGYCIGFVTTKGLMLDLDNCSLKKVEEIAEYICKTHKLEGYLIVQTSSDRDYHVIFNKYIKSWRKIMQILFNQYICIRWAIWQARKGELTLRVSTKNDKNLPKIVKRKGKTDKLISDYLEIYRLALNIRGLINQMEY